MSLEVTNAFNDAIREAILLHKGGMLCLTITGTEDAMTWRASVSRGERTGPKVLAVGEGATPLEAVNNLKRARGK